MMHEVRSKNGKEFGSKNGSKSLSALTTDERSHRAKASWIKNRAKKYDALISSTLTAANSKESIEKKKKTWEEIKHQQGENNSQFGTCWINNGDEAKKIKKEELALWINQGWKSGRKITCE